MLQRKLLLGTTVLAGVAAMAVAGAPSLALAQDTTQSSTSTTSSTTTDTSTDDGSVEALVVTGSRIKRSEYTSPAPIQVITSEQSTLEGLVDTAQIVQSSSIASGSFQANSLLSGYVITGGQNVNTISLRGLGAERTLVLINGRRLPPAGTGGSVGPVDLNVIPSTIIDRVEILKDGASSIYGSDAVAGVVNYITKKSTDGIEVDGYGSVPLDGAGQVYQLDATWGKVFDRGYLSISGSYYEQKALKAKDRDFTNCSEDYLFDATTHQRVDMTDPATGKYKCYDAINGGWQAADYFGGTFMWDPTLANAPPGGYPAAALTTRPYLPDWVRCCRSTFPTTYPYGPYQNEEVLNSDVISPIKRTSIYVTGGYDLTSNIELYGELLLNRREDSATYYQYLFEYVDPTNPNNTVAPGLIAGSLGGASGYARPLITFPYSSTQKIDYIRALGGARGTFGAGFLDGWDWDAYAMFGRSDASYNADFIYQDRVYALTGPGVACDQSQITISGGNCADLPGGIPWFTDRVLHGDLTPAEASFLKSRETGTTTYDQMMFEGSMTGDLFTLPAGKVGAAFGVVFRKDKINDLPGYNARNSNYWGFSTSGQTKGDDTVKEAYGELEIPVFKGLPLIESLTANVSGRYTDYKSYGSDSTYKIGLNWQLTDSLRVRATKGTSFRAPALFELYLANQTSFYSGTDPCVKWDESSNDDLKANCQAAGVPAGYGGPGATPMIQSGGGAGLLKAETSDAKTIGIIWTPSFMDLSVAIDYFEIEVNDEVAKFGASNILNSCYGAKTYPNDFCTLITRDATTHDVVLINDNYLNINSQVNNGIDLTTRYMHEFGFGKFTWDNQFTWQVKDTTNLLGGSTTDYNGSTNEPDFSGVSRLRFDRGDWTVNWTVTMYGKASDAELASDIISSSKYNAILYRKIYTEFTAYHTVSVRKKFDNLELLAGVQNLFDEAPPNVSVSEFRVGTAALNQFDMRGRTVFVDITKRW